MKFEDDELKGIMLIRKSALGLNNKTLAEHLGMSGQSMARLFRRPTWEWQVKTLAEVCKHLHISEQEYRTKIRF